MIKPPLVRLDVGSGSKPLAGYIGVDLYADGEGIVKAPMWELPYPDVSVDEIYCSHALEHVEKRKVVPTLKEFYRVLKEEGLITIEVPNLVWCCENWLAKRNNGWDLDAIFGNQDDGGQFHMTGFTPEIMIRYLYDAGFLTTAADVCQFREVWSHEQSCYIFRMRK